MDDVLRGKKQHQCMSLRSGDISKKATLYEDKETEICSNVQVSLPYKYVEEQYFRMRE